MINIGQKLLLCIILFSSALPGCQSLTQEKVTPKINVAVMLPLTGKDAETGKRLAKFIELGMEDGLAGQINLMTYDARDEETAQSMMNKVIAKKTKIVLGPLYSNITRAIMPSAEANDITLISLSNDPSLAAGNVYVFGHAPMRQTDRIISYFLSKDHKDFILLLPASSYSQTVASVISDIALRHHANPPKTEFYSSEPEAITASVEKIAQIVDDLNESPDSETKPVIYVADDAKNLNLIYSALRAHGLDEKAYLIGDNRADIDFPTSIHLTFTGSLNHLNYNLNAKAKERWDIHYLTFMDIMAYDLGRMTAHYIGQGLTHEQFLARLGGKLPYVGASGSIMFEDNIAIRKYDIIERNGTKYHTESKF
jgi:ABC-type branched-subunit amino acid transport system substrate-binding protein